MDATNRLFEKILNQSEAILRQNAKITQELVERNTRSADRERRAENARNMLLARRVFGTSATGAQARPARS